MDTSVTNIKIRVIAGLGILLSKRYTQSLRDYACAEGKTGTDDDVVHSIKVDMGFDNVFGKYKVTPIIIDNTKEFAILLSENECVDDYITTYIDDLVELFDGGKCIVPKDYSIDSYLIKGILYE